MFKIYFKLVECNVSLKHEATVIGVLSRAPSTNRSPSFINPGRMEDLVDLSTVSKLLAQGSYVLVGLPSLDSNQKLQIRSPAV